MNEVRLVDANALPTHVAYEDENGYPCEFVYKCDIDAAPTVPAEVVRHGYWIAGDDYDDMYKPWATCSACLHLKLSGMSRYCPNCGALMDAKEEENG